MSEELIKYTLRLADSELIIGHKMSEWCGHGPELEEDIAVINISLDHLGQCRSYYQYAAELIGDGCTENDLAYHRNERDFSNFLLCEQDNGNYATTIARSFYYDTFRLLYYGELIHSNDERLAAIAEKSLKEVKYHFRHSAEWTIRLGDGTDESHEKMQEAIDELWPFTGELFEMDEIDKFAVEKGFGVDASALKDAWQAKIDEILLEATLEVPQNNFFQTGGKKGVHTEQLGFILAEMQYLARQHPNAIW